MSELHTISDSKEAFYKEFPFVIPHVFRKLADEIAAQIEKTINICKDALREAKLSLNDLDGFILVGGSSRISLISDLASLSCL